MDNSVVQFYDRLAGDYHLIFADWPAAVARQGEVLDKLLRTLGMPPSGFLLDCACGIGTQALGLARQGYRVHATDLSPAAVERAAREAAAMGLALTTGVADMRRLARQVTGLFEAVIACDNALPHLLTREELLLAARNIAAKLSPGGLFLASIRDYDSLVAEKPAATTPRLYGPAGSRRISFQVWDWQEDGRSYIVNQFLLTENDGGWQTGHYATTYRALLRDELGEVLAEAGFTGVTWRLPAESGYYQPVVTARWL